MVRKDLIVKINNHISKYKVYRKVVKSGGAGAVSLPKDLVGKFVYVEYLDDGKPIK